jgi:hypothetical protein
MSLSVLAGWLASINKMFCVCFARVIKSLRAEKSLKRSELRWILSSKFQNVKLWMVSSGLTDPIVSCPR